MLTKELDRKISLAVYAIIDMVKTYNRSVLYYGDRHRMTNKGIFDDIAGRVHSLYGVDIYDPTFVYECMDVDGCIDLISFSNYIKTRAKANFLYLDTDSLHLMEKEKTKNDDKREINVTKDISRECPDVIGVYKNLEGRGMVLTLAASAWNLDRIERIIKKFGPIFELFGAEKEFYMIDDRGDSFDLYFRTRR